MPMPFPHSDLNHRLLANSRRRFIALLMLAAWLLMIPFANMASGQTDTPSATATRAFKGDLFVLASQHSLVGTAFPAELKDNAQVIDAVAPMWFGPDDQGQIPPLKNCDGPYDAYVKQAHALNVKVLPILRNFKPQPMLADPAAIQRCIDETARLVQTHGFDGIVVDFEHLEAVSRQPLVELVKGITAKLKPMGKLVVVAVPAYAWKQEIDYASLASHSDYLYVMTYDYTGQWVQRIGPTSPWSWPAQRRDIQRDLAIILQEEGVAPSKLLMGIALYGMDFTLDQDPARHTGVVVSYGSQLLNLAQQHQAKVTFDDALLASRFNYVDTAGQSHEVWIDDTPALAGKLQKTRELGLAGIGIWAIRYPVEPVGDMLWKLLAKPAR